MSSNKSGMRPGAGSRSGSDLAGTLLKIIAVGVAGGAALIGGAMKLGEQIEKKQKEEYIRLEQEHEAQREAVMAAAAADAENVEATAKEIFEQPEATAADAAEPDTDDTENSENPEEE